MREPMVAPCSGWEETLATIHIDSLSPAEREALNRHVACCEACATVLKDYLEMDDLIRSSLSVNQPLELCKELLPEQSVPSYNSGLFLDSAGNADAWYTIRISALCWTRYTEMLLDEQEGEEVIAEIFIGQTLFGLFERVTMGNMSLRFHSPELPTKRPYYSIQMDAQCYQSLEPLTLKAMELRVEDAINAVLLELFGVAIVDEITIDPRSKCTREEVGEQTDKVSSGYSFSN